MSLVEPSTIRLALGVEYDGSGYRGWQRQREVATVQAELERSISKIAAHPVSLCSAGRTDAGVHGTGQVIHFDTTAIRPDSAWTLGINASLPKDIAIKWVQQVPIDFHARFSALARRYNYLIYNHPLRPALLNHAVSHYHTYLHAAKMHSAAQFLIGEHDFTSFRAAQCQSLTPWRNIHHINIKRLGDYIIVDIQANAFLHHMVRNIVGSLLQVGAEMKDENWIAELLIAKNRTLAATTAKAEGLYLVEVIYPDIFSLPRSACGPLFISNL